MNSAAYLAGRKNFFLPVPYTLAMPGIIFDTTLGDNHIESCNIRHLFNSPFLEF
jgi:hypothetical protein